MLQFAFVLALVPETENPAAFNLSRLDIDPRDRVLLKRNDQIHVYHVEIDLAAKRPKQDNCDEDFDPYETKHKDSAAGNSTLQSLLISVPQLAHETADNFNTKLTEYRKELEQHLPPVAPPITLTRFVQPDSATTLVNLVFPQRDLLLRGNELTVMSKNGKNDKV